MHHIVCGVDPGRHTGFSEFNTHTGKLEHVSAHMIHVALARVKELHEWGWLSHVVFEDARLRKWFGTQRGTKADAARKQGAGSVKRDSTIWHDFLGDLGIPFKSVSPQAKGSKVDSKRFQQITGWMDRTNEHGRDSAMLVWGARALQRTEDLE